MSLMWYNRAIQSKIEIRKEGQDGAYTYILALFAVVFIWRAIWDWSELYFTSTGSFIIGLILVSIVALLQREHVWDLFG